jgi:uncharacterized protein (DUF433 family)
MVRHNRDDQMTRVITYYLRHARGNYMAERASQLSGVPISTVYYWRRIGVYIPDFSEATPAAWSYRDLVYLRLLAWLRQLGMERGKARDAVTQVARMIQADETPRYLRADSQSLLVDSERTPRFEGHPNHLPFDDLNGLLSTFDLHEPVEELRRDGHRAWAPHLIMPSKCTRISPLVMAGDPCIEKSRIPTSAVFALREDRGLSAHDIVELYPDGLTEEAADDAYLLERRLRGYDLPISA